SDAIELGHFMNRHVGDEYLQGYYLFVDPSNPDVYMLMMDVFGYEKEIIDHRTKRLKKEIKKLGGVIGDPAPADDTYDGILSGLSDVFTAGVWHFFGSGTLRIDDIEFLYKVWREEVLEKRGYTKAAFGGQILPRHWLAFMVTNYKEPDEWDETMKLADEINEIVLNGPVVPYGIGGKHGLRPFLAARDTGYYRLLKEIKKTIDPKNILQRGILFRKEDLE
ncbi:MAG: hypothetical protein ACFFD9_10550, partial [Candidatus Thorarchaeota archaeon]